MNDMIERVAKAIALRDTTDEFAMTRAAIEAMREPTEEMIKVGFSMTATAQSGTIDIEEVWQAMLDAALKDD